MPHDRLRVLYYLPDTGVEEFTAYLKVLDYLKSEMCPLRATGFSESRVSGEFWDQELGWIQDTVRIVTVAYTVVARYETQLQEISDFLSRSYADSGSPQIELWMITDWIRVNVWPPPEQTEMSEQDDNME